MEQIYKIDWSKNSHKLGHRGNVVCAWSSSNLFAFTTEKEVQGYSKQFLNVLNPNQPWDIFCVSYIAGEINCIEWDNTGTRFVTGDTHGLCSMWVMTNSMSNIWSRKSRHSIDLHGEEILKVGWLHPGVRVLFHIDKLELSNLSEKFERVKFRPSVVQFGGKHIDGYVVVTGSGLVSAKLLKSDVDTVSGQVYLNVSCHQKLADIKFTSQGKVVILTSDGDIQHLIKFHELELKYDSEDAKLTFDVNALPSLPLRCANDEQSVFTHISHAQFVSRENKDNVLVCISGPTGSKFESWLIMKENIQVHRILQQTPPPSSTPESTLYWHFVTESKVLPKVMNFSVPPSAMDASSSVNKVSQENKFYCGLCIAVALADNTIMIIHRLSLQPLLVEHLEKTSVDETTMNKRLKTGSCVQNVTFSSLSCALVAVDERGSLLLYKVAPWLDKPGKAAIQALKQIVQLLLYCIITGCEWWDVLLHVQPNDVDNIIEQISLEMNKQATPLQQVLQSRLLSLKITIYQISSNAATTDCHLKLLFDAVSLVFRSLVRPAQQVTSEENDPAMKLQMISRTSFETDINKLLQNVDTDPQSLLSMQQLIQWVADTTLYLLASVPYYKQPNRPGMVLIHDRGWLSVLREMLVLIHVWGLLKSACSPVFHVLDSKLEILPHAFRLITQLWQTSTDDARKCEIPQNLINECSLIPSQVLITPLEIISPVNGILNRVKSLSGGGIMRLTFGQPQADPTIHSARQNQLDFVAVPGSSGKIDSLRRLFLGKKPNQELKECTRCGITTMYNNFSRSALKVWDQRFIRSCLCGGKWRKVGISGHAAFT